MHPFFGRFVPSTSGTREERSVFLPCPRRTGAHGRKGPPSIMDELTVIMAEEERRGVEQRCAGLDRRAVWTRPGPEVRINHAHYYYHRCCYYCLTNQRRSSPIQHSSQLPCIERTVSHSSSCSSHDTTSPPLRSTVLHVLHPISPSMKSPSLSLHPLTRLSCSFLPCRGTRVKTDSWLYVRPC